MTVKILELDPLETHDRFEYFTQESKQTQDVSECCQDLIDKRPFGDEAFYIFAHARTEDNGIDKRVLWQARLSKPEPQANSMLFRAYPGTDTINVIWMIPASEMWGQFRKGVVTENQLIAESIHKFIHKPLKLAEREPDEQSDERKQAILIESLRARQYPSGH